MRLHFFFFFKPVKIENLASTEAANLMGGFEGQQHLALSWFYLSKKGVFRITTLHSDVIERPVNLVPLNNISEEED